MRCRSRVWLLPRGEALFRQDKILPLLQGTAEEVRGYKKICSKWLDHWKGDFVRSRLVAQEVTWDWWGPLRISRYMREFCKSGHT